MQAILTTTTANPVMHTSSKSPGSLPTHRRTKHRHQCHESSDQEAEIHCLDENSWVCRRGSSCGIAAVIAKRRGQQQRSQGHSKSGAETEHDINRPRRNTAMLWRDRIDHRGV